ncbi:MAG: tetratricopeptide repeat protein, partial [Selenomonadaceae bacterium]|nr:tetratricopeptide repeat protein [Selenomonadaceae bacterium]
MYIGRKLSRLIAASLIVGSMTFMPIGHAEIKTYTGVGEYIMSDFETPEIAKQRAKQYAERNAQEQAGVYINSYTKVENFKVTEDEIITMSNGILSVTDVKFDIITIPEHAGIVYRATIQANIDSDKVDEWISKGVSERSELVAKNQELQKAIDEQEKQITELKKELEKVKTAKDEEKLKTKFEEADKVFLSNQKVQEGNDQFPWDKDLAFKLYNEAIKLNPNNGASYFNRASVYISFQQYSDAVNDLTKAMSLHVD